jgi:hypothetical protein
VDPIATLRIGLLAGVDRDAERLKWQGGFGLS